VRAGAFNIGQLTFATNGLAATHIDYADQTLDYDANGLLIKKASKIAYAASASVTHTEETAYEPTSKLVVYKTYDANLTTALRDGSGNLHSGYKWNFCLTLA